MAQIKFQDVLRDAVQSLFGTNPSAQEIIDSYPTVHLTGTHAIQTGGGTFFDLFAKKGRNEWNEVEKLIKHFRDLGVRQSALIRGDFLFGYEPQPYDVIRALVFEYAAMGMNVLQNGIDRTIVKAWVSSTIGHHCFHTRWPKNAIQEMKDAGLDKAKEMTMTSLQPTVLDHFPMLADWPSGKVTWADLMFIESEIIIGTMVELMRSYSVPCFSVHDSIIVKTKDQQIAMETLESQFLGRTTIEPRLKVK
jgi:hypothetical protein